jgi:hypothetical protein
MPKGSIWYSTLTSVFLTFLTCCDAMMDSDEPDENRSPIRFGKLMPTSSQSAQESILAAMTSPEGMWRRELEDDENDIPVKYRSRMGSLTVVIMASLSVLLALGACWFIWKYRKNSIVSIGQPPFLYMVCFGSILISSSTCFTAFDEGNGRTRAALDASCVAQIWFYSIGNIVVYMTLFCKLWRVHRVTQFRRAQRILVQHVIGPFVIIILGAIGILIAWTIQNPPRWGSDVFYSMDDGTATVSYGICSSGTGLYSFAMSMLLILSMVIALWMSCKTKNIREDISDSRRVCQTLCCQLIFGLLTLVMVVVAYTLQNITLLQLTDAIVILSSLTAIGFLVVPKIYYVRFELKTGHLPEGLTRVGGTTRVTGLAAEMTARAAVTDAVTTTVSVDDDDDDEVSPSPARESYSGVDA